MGYIFNITFFHSLYSWIIYLIVNLKPYFMADISRAYFQNSFQLDIGLCLISVHIFVSWPIVYHHNIVTIFIWNIWNIVQSSQSTMTKIGIYLLRFSECINDIDFFFLLILFLQNICYRILSRSCLPWKLSTKWLQEQHNWLWKKFPKKK